jgi:hypothetical protein
LSYLFDPWNENEIFIKFAINGGAKKVPNRRLPSGISKPNMQRKRKRKEKGYESESESDAIEEEEPFS